MNVVVIVIILNISAHIEVILNSIRENMEKANCTFSIMLTDWGSEDTTYEEVERLLKNIPNCEYIGLTGLSSKDSAYMAGLENITPDNAILFDPLSDDPALLPNIVDTLRSGADLVIISRDHQASTNLPYRILSALFVSCFRKFGGVDIRALSSRYRGISLRAIPHILKQDASAIGNGIIPYIAKFKRVDIVQTNNGLLSIKEDRNTFDGIRKALTLLTSTSRTPLRLTSSLCILAALFAMVSSAYVSITYLINEGVAPGWTTLSLQMNGMFFLISLAIAMMAEYILQLKSGASHPYHLVCNLTSSIMHRTQKLNMVKSEQD